MQVDDAAADGQAQAAAGVFGLRRDEPNESLEPPLALLRIQAWALVLDADAPQAGPEHRLQRDQSVRGRDVDRIRQKIQENLPHPLRLQGDASLALVLAAEPAAVVLREHARILRERLKQSVGVLRLEVQP